MAPTWGWAITYVIFAIIGHPIPLVIGIIGSVALCVALSDLANKIT